MMTSQLSDACTSFQEEKHAQSPFLNPRRRYRGFAREAVENVLNVRRYADVAGEVTQAGSPPAI